MSCSLPREIILNVLSYAIWRGQARSGALSPLAKGGFLSGFSLASKQCREMLFREWFYLLVLHSPEDLQNPVYSQIRPHVRALTLRDGALMPRSHIKALDSSYFEDVHTIALDCHNDVGCSSSDGGKSGQWSYKKIVPRLPRGLKSLIVLNAHGPDLQIIQQAVDQCPNLEHLCLGRCTKFNRPNNCAFWENFPDDHDSYFSIKGVGGYAKALGTELKRLKKLKTIYVNVYLADTKHLFDKGNSPSESVAPPPDCTLMSDTCTSSSSSSLERSLVELASTQAPEVPNQLASDQEDTKLAEKSAVLTLFECHDTLQNAAFISYWSPGHLSWSCHGRDVEQIIQIPYIVPHLTPPEPSIESPQPLTSPKASPTRQM